jgi:hypothetical protein
VHRGADLVSWASHNKRLILLLSQVGHSPQMSNVVADLLRSASSGGDIRPAAMRRQSTSTIVRSRAISSHRRRLSVHDDINLLQAEEGTFATTHEANGKKPAGDASIVRSRAISSHRRRMSVHDDINLLQAEEGTFATTHEANGKKPAGDARSFTIPDPLRDLREGSRVVHAIRGEGDALRGCMLHVLVACRMLHMLRPT